MDPNNIIGAWSLVSCIRYTDGKAPEHSIGMAPEGLIFYTQNQRMAALLHRDPALVKDGRPALVSYAGRWTLDGDTLRHHVELSSNPDQLGQVLERNVRFEKGSMILRPPKERCATGETWVELTWHKP